MLEIMPISSLEKVFPTTRPILYERQNECFDEEIFSFQFAFRSYHTDPKNCTYRLIGNGAKFAMARSVELIGGRFPENEGSDDYVITHESVMFPDLLLPRQEIFLRCGQWNSLWVTVCAPMGDYEIGIEFYEGDNLLGNSTYSLKVYDTSLPQLSIPYTTWFHYDSLAEYYKLPVFSEEYNIMLENFLQNYTDHGMNMLLTPLFTPALNTYVGGERTTTQLVSVSVQNGEFVFDFSRLLWFMNLAAKYGIRYYEMAHLFTQWGAAAAPKIVGDIDGKQQLLFGWQTAADSKEYFTFLTAFLPALIKFLSQNGFDSDCVYFHLSDEPNGKYLAHYKKLRDFVKPLLGRYRIFDALSNHDFYKTGAVDVAVAATDATMPFLESGDKNFWVYYCCGQSKEYVSNRFFNMQLQRTRIIGFQLYITGCAGFLHWGYNYYNSMFSERYLNPFLETDAGGYFQSGDSFLVYPGKSGALDSVRGEVMREAMNDYRACQLLENKIGRQNVVQLLKQGGMKEDFFHYPMSAVWHIQMRKTINDKIMER